MQPPKNLNPERRANYARRSSRSLLPRPPLRDFTTEMQAERADGRRPLFLPAKNAGSKVRGLAAPATPQAGVPKTKTLWGHLRVRCRFLMEPAPSHRPWCPRQARPQRGRIQLIMSGYCNRSKPELSTLLESGTFYFAPTSIVFSNTSVGPTELGHISKEQGESRQDKILVPQAATAKADSSVALSKPGCKRGPRLSCSHQW